MEHRELGNTHIKVSTVAFGSWAIVGDETWGPQKREDAIAAIRAAYHAGVNFFDTATTYGNGESERLLGEALAGMRPRVVIASKVASSHFSPDQLRASWKQSARKLRTDYIDLLQLHWPNPDIPATETLAVMEELKKEGKIRAYGVSNFGKTNLSSILASGIQIASNQMAYSLLFRAVEFEILPLCRDRHIALLCYSPLMQGLLTGKFTSPDQVPVGRARTRHFSFRRTKTRHGEPGFEEAVFQAIAAIREIAAELDISMSELSLAWLLAQPGVTSVIAGARSPDQAASNARAGDRILDSGIVDRLSRITDPLKQAMGPNADMWQKKSRVL